MRVAGALCIVVGLGLLVGLPAAGRSSARARAIWTPHSKIKIGLAGVAAIVAGILLLVGGVE